MSTREQSVPAHRAYVGPSGQYDFAAAWQFNLLTTQLELREWHHVLEIGCGSLRVGRLLIPYLLPGHYCGLEPNRWLVEAGLAAELGEGIVALKEPTFRHDEDFALSRFERPFDLILAQSIFSHTSKAQMQRCLREAEQVLAPKGVFAATFIEGEADYEGEEWVYPDGVAFRAETVRALAAEAGLAALLLDWPTPNGQRWALFHHPTHVVKLAALLDEETLRARLQARRGRGRSARRGAADPIATGALIERLQQIAEHPAVAAAAEEDPALAELLKST